MGEMMKAKDAKKIMDKISEYPNIVLLRHVSPDPDCLGSQLALRDLIKRLFKDKNVYAFGKGAPHLSYLGELDEVKKLDSKNTLAIVLDTPDKKRIDVDNLDVFDYLIKIDHHPFDHEYCDYEYIDDTASSVCEVIISFCECLEIELREDEAKKLYTGIVSDTERFLQSYTKPKTFSFVSRLVDNEKVDITDVYNNLYLRPLEDYKLMGYIYEHVVIMESGFAYIKLSREWLRKNNIDTQIVGKIANCLNYIKEILSWAIITEEETSIRLALRSRGPIVNEIAIKYGGGGHKYISGVSLKSFDEVEKIIKELSENCVNYKKISMKRTPKCS